MKRLLLSVFLLAFVALGCDSFVENVEEPPDNIAEAQLLDASQVPFLIRGVQTRFATTHDNVTLVADLLSDQAEFGQNGDATFPTYRDIDEGDITFDNNSVDGAFNLLGEYRELADQLVTRIEEIDALPADGGGFADGDPARADAFFTAYLHGGIARYFYAAYFGLEPEVGGGVINKSPLIPSDEMYDLALDRLDTALQYASTDYQTRLVNSLKARIHLFKGEYPQAGSLASQGLDQGDEPFQSLHSVQSSNAWWTQAGLGRLQVVVAERFRDYIAADEDEIARVPILSIGHGIEGEPIAGPLEQDPDVSEPFQNLYPEQGSSITLMSWQETDLIEAEVALRTGGSGALALVNGVRESHGLEALASVDLNTIATERDKEMFAEGIRLIDQRRFDPSVLDFHLDAGAWQFLPITQQERNDNPCIPQPTSGCEAAS